MNSRMIAVVVEWVVVVVEMLKLKERNGWISVNKVT